MTTNVHNFIYPSSIILLVTNQTTNMQVKIIMMMAVLLVLVAIITTASTYQQDTDDDSFLDKRRFSLREVIKMMANKRRTIHLSHNSDHDPNFVSLCQSEKITEKRHAELFICHDASSTVRAPYLIVEVKT
jgi:hypothetical protein